MVPEIEGGGGGVRRVWVVVVVVVVVCCIVYYCMGVFEGGVFCHTSPLYTGTGSVTAVTQYKTYCQAVSPYRCMGMVSYTVIFTRRMVDT